MNKSLKGILILTCVMCLVVLIVFAMIWPNIQTKEGKSSIEILDSGVYAIQEYEVFYKNTKLSFYSWEERTFVRELPTFRK